MPKSNHGTRKKPGRAKWFTRRNIQREYKRRKDNNSAEDEPNVK